MAVPTYTVTCLKKKEIAPGIYELVFEKPEGFQFKPGQFILFDVPLVENPTDVQTRAFSLASTPVERDLLFLIKITPNGRMSRWIEEVCQEGSQLVMKGPFGLFVLDEKTEKNYLFVATGTGIAPFRGHVKYLLEQKGDTRKMDLVFSMREIKDLFWIDEFRAIEQAFPNFKFHVSLTTKNSVDWHGHKGRVQEIIPQIVPDFGAVNVYICGMPQMVADLKKMCIETWGLEKKDLHVEGYI